MKKCQNHSTGSLISWNFAFASSICVIERLPFRSGYPWSLVNPLNLLNPTIHPGPWLTYMLHEKVKSQYSLLYRILMGKMTFYSTDQNAYFLNKIHAHQCTFFGIKTKKQTKTIGTLTQKKQQNLNLRMSNQCSFVNHYIMHSNFT